MSNRKFVNYAHRGASTYCPENTMLSFYTGIYMGANGIETDVQKTKDGVIVLFHDDTLNRILGIDGSIADYTYEELLTYDVKNGELRDKIPTLEDFLTHFAHFDLTFAIELKVQGIEREVAKIIRKHGVEEKVVITSFIYDAVKEMRRVAPELKCGLLKRYFANPETDAVLENAFTPIVKELISLGFAEICPIGEDCKPEIVKAWKEAGLGVRAWGIFNTDIMKKVYDAGVDGMTVNFPDKLTEYISEQ